MNQAATCATVTAVLVRREHTTDAPTTAEIHKAAFQGEVESQLVSALRVSEAWLPALSLVAELDGQVVGHVVCTRAHVGAIPALGLGPLGVAPAAQKSGVGSALMHAVLAAADALDEPVVVLLGHTGYYPRFGFEPATHLGITPPVPEWGDHFQARPLSTYDTTIQGPFAYAPPFNDL
jgi:putative acetyltransferase